MKRLFFIGISSSILPRKFYLRIPLTTGRITITRAHRPDEYITAAELAECCAMLQALAGSAEMR
ncbi:hypothetical protein [Paracoccus yeei]|uniref:hypothetical protein n=1 Tax=Paracoccus yeei TaxID=147645 RepID=UPI003BF8C54F